MLVRVGIAVTCSVAAYTLTQLKHKGDHKDSPIDKAGRNKKKKYHEGFEYAEDDSDSQLKSLEEDVKRVNPPSPAQNLSNSYGSGGGVHLPESDAQGGEYLLPEFEALCSGELQFCPEELLARTPPGRGPHREGDPKVRIQDRESAEVLCGGDEEPHPEAPSDGHPCCVQPHNGHEESKEFASPGGAEAQSTELDGALTDSFSSLLRSMQEEWGAETPVRSAGRKAGSTPRKLKFLEVDATVVDNQVASRLFSDTRDVLAANVLGEDVNPHAGDAMELQVLRNAIEELRRREMKLEGELLEYYGLQEREEEFLEMEQKMREQTDTIADLKVQVGALEAQAKRMATEIAAEKDVKKDLADARTRIRALQNQLHTESGQSKAELLMLKQKVSAFEAREIEGNKRDLDLEKKLQALRELEVEVVELRRTSKDIQHQKRELTIKLSAAEARLEHLSKPNENPLVAQAEANTAALRHANEDLCRQIEGLQNNRFSEVEELVYLRWVNACLRYELRKSQAPTGTISALDLNKNLSPKSQANAKQLMLEYAGPDLLAMRGKDQSESGYESTSSEASTPSESIFSEGAGDLSDLSSDLGSGRLSKKPSLIHRLKKWTRRKEDKKDDGPHDLSSGSSSMERDRRSPRHCYQEGLESKGPLESLILRNSSEAVEITTYGTKDVGNDSPGRSDTSSNDGVSMKSDTATSRLRPNLPPISTKRVDKDLSGVATSFQLMSKSVIGTELADKYPAFKDRHKAATEREKTIKEKASIEREKVNKEKAEQNAGTAPVRRYIGSESKVTSSLFPRSHEAELMPGLSTNTNKRTEIAKKPPAEVERRALRKAKPPPKRSSPGPAPSGPTQVPNVAAGVSPPPPPPPPPRPPCAGGTPPPPPPPPPLGGLSKLQGGSADKMQRAPGIVEFYQSLMKRDAKKESSGGAGGGGGNPEARNNMIGEIENRSTHLLAIKADVETQGEFVESLATEVRAAAFTDIEDVVEFVNWLDEELSFLVDERAVLKHFDWPEGKADALREASFQYRDLKKLQEEVSSFQDKPELPCDAALKKILNCLEKMEQSVYALLRTREMAIARYKEVNVPTQWMLDNGLVGKIKEAAVRLSRLYMKRVSTELDQLAAGPEKEPLREFLLLQGVRFAFRVHQFAGGFDARSMAAFEALRNRAHVRSSSEQEDS